jgi:hypothetical protein
MAQVSYYTGHRWWLLIAVPIWLAAIAIYTLMTWLILWRAVAERQDRDGFEPDTWILMGGLAIATLAGDHLYQQVSGWPAAAVRMVTVITWVAATLWIPPLILLRAAPHQPAARGAAVHRCLVVAGLPAWHVFGGHRRRGGRARPAVDADDLIGFLLERLDGLADRGGRRTAACSARARR